MKLRVTISEKATRLEVICVVREKDDGPISHLEVRDEEGRTRQISVDAFLESDINRKIVSLFTRVDDTEAEVVVRRREDESLYATTKKNDTEVDNLLFLPECGAGKG